jgi:hypothetical protein
VCHLLILHKKRPGRLNRALLYPSAFNALASSL